MQIETKKISELIPAPYNPRKIGKKELESLKNSLKEFGYVEPVIWNKATGYVIGGHQRLKALKELGVEEVECVVIDVPEEKEKALNIALNKISGDWDKDKLFGLLDELDTKDFDITLTGFELADLDDYKFDEIETHDAREQSYDHYRLFEYDSSRTAGYYQLPTIKACHYVPDELISFNYARSYKGNCNGVGVHFFIDDYQFERIWDQPFKIIERLKRFSCVFMPDFSIYMDMPKAMQIWNLYRMRMIGQIMQDAGLNMIPIIRTFGDDTIEMCLEGIEPGGVYAISTLGLKGASKEFKELCKHELEGVIKILTPSTILLYGYDNVIDYDFHNVPVKCFKPQIFKRK